MKITDSFCYNRRHHAKLTLFLVSKDEWDTKKGPGKSMKNVLHAQRDGKRAEARLNSEKVKPVASAIVKLCLSESVRQPDS